MSGQPIHAILTANPANVGPGAPISEVLGLMEGRHISSVLAVDEEQRPLGIFTEQDALRLMALGKNLDGLRMADAMHQPVFTVPADLDYRDAYRQMAERRFRHVAVVDAAGKLQGIVSEGDFLHYLGMEYLVELKTVACVMTPDPRTLPEHASLKDAIDVMAEHRYSCILVTRGEKPVGMLTERDVVALASQELDPASTPMGAVMHGPVTCIEADSPAQEAMRRMQQSGIRRLAVLDHGRLVGLVTRHDIVKSLQGRYVEYLNETIRRQREDLARVQDQMHCLRDGDLMQQLDDAVFVVDAASAAIVEVNEQACRSLGYRREELLALTVPQLSSNLGNAAAWQDFCNALRGQRQLLSETGQRHHDGSILPVQVNARLVVTNGREYVVAIARDLSRLRTQDAQLRLQVHALNAAANAIVITDRTSRILWANAAFSSLTGYSQHEALGRTPAELVKSGRHDPAFYQDMWRTILAGKVWHGEIINRHRDGNHYNEELTITPVCADDGEISHFIAVKRDISERKAMEEELRHLAATDTLTGLANRRHFLGQMALALARYQRHGTPATLLMLDLDWFKRVNDRYGHATGDEVLKHVTRVMAASLRRIDLLGRLGGEEFAILLPDTDAAGAYEFAERLRQQLSDQPARSGDETIPISVSIGVSPFLPADGHIDEILARTDRALYRAKARGRNRVELEAAG